MSQEQPQRPQQAPGQADQGIKYGDVFPGVQGELASKPVGPRDAATLQSAENMVLGQTVQGGVAATMQSAATYNERAGVVGHTDASDVAGNQGVNVTETVVPGARVMSESIGDQVVGQYVQPIPMQGSTGGAGGGGGSDVGESRKITIGEALEATALTAGDKPVDQSDAAAIQAAEVRATGQNVIAPGGVAAAAQSAATANTRLMRDEDKYKLADVLTDAALRLPSDKPVTARDAEGVLGAELRNNPNIANHPGGVAASVVAAARINQQQGGV